MLTSTEYLDKEWHPINFLEGSKWYGSHWNGGICPHSDEIKRVLTILNVSGQQLEDTDWFYCGFWINPEDAINPKKPHMTCRQAVLKLRSLIDSAMIAAENPHSANTSEAESDLACVESYRKSAEDLRQLVDGMKTAKRVLPQFSPLQIVLDAESLCTQLCVAAFGTVDLNMIICLTKEADQGCSQRP